MNKYPSLLLLLLISLPLAAQVSGNANYNDVPHARDRSAMTEARIADENAMTMTINGIYNVRADRFVATFNVIQLGETAEQADRLARARIEKFISAIRRLKIDSADVKIDMISFVPRYEVRTENKIFSKDYNEIPEGFELQKNILITCTHSATLDLLVTAAASAEIYDLVKVDYFVSDIEKPTDQLREKCLAALKNKSKIFEALGLKPETMKKVIADHFTVTYPATRYAGYVAVSRPSMDAVKKRSPASFMKYNEVYKPTTRYYDPVSYDHYDVVVNPVISEPMIQLSYSITVRYIAPEEKAKDYVVVTPQGEVKKLALP